jgi:ubiquitin-protein ligase
MLSPTLTPFSPAPSSLSPTLTPVLVYEDGRVCISILHPPGDDLVSGETAAERWLPTQTVQTILLSVISMLNDPNCSSPANVDASVEWRNSRPAYIARCAGLVAKSKACAPSDVVVGLVAD